MHQLYTQIRNKYLINNQSITLECNAFSTHSIVNHALLLWIGQWVQASECVQFSRFQLYQYPRKFLLDKLNMPHVKISNTCLLHQKKKKIKKNNYVSCWHLHCSWKGSSKRVQSRHTSVLSACRLMTTVKGSDNHIKWELLSHTAQK